MEITEDLIYKLKAELTEDDLKRMKRDFELKRHIDATYDDVEELYKFLLLYSIMFLSEYDIDIEGFISALRKAQGATSQLEKLTPKGH